MQRIAEKDRLHRHVQLPKINLMSDKKNLILIVDDEEGIRNLIQGILEDEGYRTLTASNDTEAYEMLRDERPDLVIQDIWLQNSEDDGIEILKKIKAEKPHIPVIMISGHGTIETAVNAIKIGAYDFIEKPFKSDRLILMIERAIENAKLKAENRTLKQKMETHIAKTELVGTSNSTQHLRHTIERIAATNSRILLTGEPGTGKDYVAHYIHMLSDRVDQPFMAVNCAILTPDRLEMELFGTAHTINGEPPHQGVLERADGGTLLLDEVADMPLETQGKILRVLQEQCFQRVGSDTEIHVDVRIIASSNQNLETEMENGNFRKDLYYRLNVVPVHLDPLRERPQDIKPLVQYFIAQYSEQAGLPKQTFSSATYAVLQSYDWPGNIRQLKNTVEWVMIMHKSEEGEEIMPHDLPPDISGHDKTEQDDIDETDYAALPLKKARERFEANYMRSQIERFKGNISKTAEFVGMERSALHRKLKQLGLNEDKSNSNNSQIEDDQQKQKAY